MGICTQMSALRPAALLGGLLLWSLLVLPAAQGQVADPNGMFRELVALGSQDAAVPTYELPSLDNAVLLGALKQSKRQGLYRFGKAIKVDIDTESFGVWRTVHKNWSRWSLRLASDTALSLNLLFDDFHLPRHAEFYVSTSDVRQSAQQRGYHILRHRLRPRL